MNDFPKGGNVEATRDWLYKKGFIIAADKVKYSSIINASAQELLTNDGRKVELLSLPNKDRWPFLQSNMLFVRDFYKSFYDTHIGIYRKGSKLIVCGTPGIGKSAFGLYCIYRGLMDGKTVVYHTSKYPKWLIYQSQTVSDTFEPPTELLEDFSNVVYIADSIRAFSFTCPTIRQ
eukprot:gene14692-19739_t